MKAYLIFLLDRRKRQRAFIAAAWQRVQSSERVILYRLIHNLTLFDEPIAFSGGTIVRTSIRMFTVIDKQGNAHSFAGKTLAMVRDNLIAYLQGERVAEYAAINHSAILIEQYTSKISTADPHADSTGNVEIYEAIQPHFNGFIEDVCL